MREASTSSEAGDERTEEPSSNAKPSASEHGPAVAAAPTSVEHATDRLHAAPARPEAELARTARSTAPTSSRRVPSRSPSNLQQWHNHGQSRGALTTPVLQILERTSATLEHLASERPKPPPHAAEDWVRGACSSSRANPVHGNRRPRRPSGSASHRCSSSESPTSRNSPQRKLERYLEVRCGTAEDLQLGPTSVNALTCSTLGVQESSGATSSAGHRTIRTSLCSGAMASVLTTESLIALRDDKIASRPPKLIPIEPTDATLEMIETANEANASVVWIENMSSWLNDAFKHSGDGNVLLQSLLRDASQSLMGPLETWMGPHEQWSCRAVWRAISDVYWHGFRHDSSGPPYFRPVD